MTFFVNSMANTFGSAVASGEAATNGSQQLAGISVSGTGGIGLRQNSPTLIAPALGTITSGDLSAGTGNASGLYAGGLLFGTALQQMTLATGTAGSQHTGDVMTIISGSTTLGFSTPIGAVIQAQTVSGAASVSFTTGINSTYTTYILYGKNISGSTTASLRALVQQGGSFITSSSYNYTGVTINQVPTVAGFGTGSSTFLGLGTGNISTTTAVPNSFALEFYTPSNALPLNLRFSSTTGNSAANAINNFGGCYVNLSAVTTGIQIILSAGTITGNFTLIGVS